MCIPTPTPNYNFIVIVFVNKIHMTIFIRFYPFNLNLSSIKGKFIIMS